MPGSPARIRSQVARDLPAGLYLTYLFAGFFGFGLLLLLPVVLAELLVAYARGTLGERVASTDFWTALSALILLAVWLLFYWSALRLQARWFRRFVIFSAAVSLLAWCAGAVLAGANLLQLATAPFLFFALPWWYLYRRRAVVAYFEGLRRSPADRASA